MYLCVKKLCYMHQPHAGAPINSANILNLGRELEQEEAEYIEEGKQEEEGGRRGVQEEEEQMVQDVRRNLVFTK